MLPKESLHPAQEGKVNHHRIKKIIIGAVIVPVILFILLLVYVFVSDVFYRSKNIKQGNYDVLDKFNTTTKTPTPTNTYDVAKQDLIEGLGNPSFGTNKPKLTIVEFSDFACPYCKASSAGLRELANAYQAEVKLVFRDWPGHTNSVALALAAHCAGEQGKFWEMHDKLYLNQSAAFGADKNDLAVLANDLGIYNEQFQACFDTQKYLGRIQKNIMDSETLGIKGTPTWFFNGEKLEGELTKQNLEEIIRQYVTK